MEPKTPEKPKAPEAEEKPKAPEAEENPVVAIPDQTTDNFYQVAPGEKVTYIDQIGRKVDSDGNLV